MPIDLTGKVFGRLTAVSRNAGSKFKGVTWTCVCQCGKTVKVAMASLTTGHTKSCGCYSIDLVRTIKLRHGLSKTRAHRIWAGMVQRCTNPKNIGFKLYGGRGITVCDAWLSFDNFYHDMGHPPDGHSLDRIDNNAGYSKENCRWATKLEQARNKRNSIIVTVNGVSRCLPEWTEISGVAGQVILKRLNRGVDPYIAVFTPSFGRSIPRHGDGSFASRLKVTRAQPRTCT